MLAQVAPAPAAETGNWLAVLIAVLGVIWVGRQLWTSFFPVKPSGEQYVTHEDLEDAEERLRQEIGDLRSYAHENVHGIREVIQPLVTGAAVNEERMRALQGSVRAMRREMRDSAKKTEEYLGTIAKAASLMAEHGRREE